MLCDCAAQRSIILVVLLISACFLQSLVGKSVELKIINQADYPVEIFWLDPEAAGSGNEKLVSMGPPIDANSEVGLNSFNGHKFVARFHDSAVILLTASDPPPEARFTKGPTSEQIIIEYDVEHEQLRVTNPSTEEKLLLHGNPSFPQNNPPLRNKSGKRFPDIVEAVNYATKACQDLRGEALSSCIAGNIIEDVTHLSDSKTQMDKFRDLMSSRLRNYTCVDDNMDSSPPIRSYDVSLQTILGDKYSQFEQTEEEQAGGDRAKDTYRVNVLLDKDHAKIWTVDDFVSPEECDVLIKYGRPRLTRATVAAEDGTSIISEARKANQASYNMRANRPEEDPLWPLYNRILGLTNHHAGYNLEPPGQEDFTIIQYNPDDQYSPHCDGACDNEMHVSTGRVATAVMYCKTADKGGATTFTKADVFVKPKVGSTTFFSYKGSDGRMDSGLTEHSGCPVLQGEKFITTVWMREGVSGSKPWTKYDPSGVLIAQG